MTEPTTPSVPAGWYPDPAGSPNSRWWDGVQWTDSMQQPYSPGVVTTPRAAEGTPVYNLWIWLAIFAPYLSLPLLFTLDFSSLLDPSALTSDGASLEAQLGLYTSPGFLLLTVGGWVTTAAAVLFSWLDHRWLVRAGVPQPFSWAWSFFILLGYPVYPIGRAIVTRRRTGRGWGVLWATILAFVGGILIALIWGIVITVQITQSILELAPN